MKKTEKFFVILFLVKLSYFPLDRIFAHLCHDPFRPREHLFLSPEEDLIRIQEQGEFRIYVENTFRSVLQNVKLFVENEAFDIEIKPQVLKRLAPEERIFFQVKIKLRKGFESGEYPLRISVGARSAEIRPTVEKLEVVVDKKVPQLERKPIPEIRPKNEIKEEKIEESEEKLFQPEKKNQLQPKEVKIAEKPIYPQKKKIPEHKHKEEKIKEVSQEVGKVVVKVERLPFWKRPYFYIILIFLLLGIFIWRKIKK